MRDGCWFICRPEIDDFPSVTVWLAHNIHIDSTDVICDAICMNFAHISSQAILTRDVTIEIAHDNSQNMISNYYDFKDQPQPSSMG
jgi:hypothetical protein